MGLSSVGWIRWPAPLSSRVSIQSWCFKELAKTSTYLDCIGSAWHHWRHSRSIKRWTWKKQTWLPRFCLKKLLWQQLFLFYKTGSLASSADFLSLWITSNKGELITASIQQPQWDHFWAKKPKTGTSWFLKWPRKLPYLPGEGRHVHTMKFR